MSTTCTYRYADYEGIQKALFDHEKCYINIVVSYKYTYNSKYSIVKNVSLCLTSVGCLNEKNRCFNSRFVARNKNLFCFLFFVFLAWYTIYLGYRCCKQ